MKIVTLSIANFRGLENISLDTDKNVNVIVGPNAIGKTTILEAVRLTKSLLSPRYYQEAQQTLISLGALPQNFQFFGTRQIDYVAIARDPAKDVRIAVDVVLEDREIQLLKQNAPNISIGLVRTQVGRNDEQAQFALTQFLSSPAGATALDQAGKATAEQLEKLATTRRLSLQLTISANRNAYFGADAFSQIAFGILDQMLPAQMAAVSYFPADRAFPPGEVAIQIGSGDASNQVQSHMGSPGGKYARLKQTIVHGIITNQINLQWLHSEFDLILDNLVPGKKLKGVEINPLGQLKVLISDTNTGKVFDIDSMSSGEKGVILTFLLIRHTMAEGGLLLIDEPELHLNPAVEKKLLNFLVDHCVKPRGLQVFACTHSPEIVGVAFEREDTSLFHLRSSLDLTKVLRRDQSEMYEALRRLGASTADVLFSRGTIIVEGEHDAEILSEGFFDLVSGYKLTHAGGRNEVEKEIDNLQKAEAKGAVEKESLFILDLDDRPTERRSSARVRVLQWDRYCLENFLIEPDLLFDLVMQTATNKPNSRGSFSADLKGLAMSQVQDVAVREIYAGLVPDSPGLRSADLIGKSIEETAGLLADRLLRIAEQTRNLNREAWLNEFQRRASERIEAMKAEWEPEWRKRCSGKRLIQDLYRKHEINLDPLSFKKRLISQMRATHADGWSVVESRIRASLS